MKLFDRRIIGMLAGFFAMTRCSGEDLEDAGFTPIFNMFLLFLWLTPLTVLHELRHALATAALRLRISVAVRREVKTRLGRLATRPGDPVSCQGRRERGDTLISPTPSAPRIRPRLFTPLVLSFCLAAVACASSDPAPDAALDAAPLDASIGDRPVPDAASAPDADFAGWLFTAGGGASDRLQDIVLDPDGDIIAVGSFKQSMTLGSTTLTCSGFQNIFVARFTLNGVVKWATAATGSSLNIAVERVALDPQGNILVAGTFGDSVTLGSTTLTCKGDHDAFVAKLSPKGSFLWAIGLGGSSLEYGRGLAVDAKGAAFVTGWFHKTASFGAGSLTSAGMADVFVAKLGASGAVEWVTALGGVKSENAYAAAAAPQGGVYVAGTFSETITVGQTSLTAKGLSDTFLARLDASGKPVWAVSGGGAGYDRINDIVLDAAGAPIVFGEFGKPQATFDAATLTTKGHGGGFVVKYDDSGKQAWAVALDSDGVVRPFRAATCPDGNLIAVGVYHGAAVIGADTLTSKGTGITDVFVARLQGTGQATGGLSAGGAKHDYAFGAACGPQAAYVGGYFLENAAFGGHSAVALGNNNDLFLWAIPR